MLQFLNYFLTFSIISLLLFLIGMIISRKWFLKIRDRYDYEKTWKNIQQYSPDRYIEISVRKDILNSIHLN